MRELLDEARRDFEATDTLHEFVAAQAAFSPDAATWVDLSAQIDDLNRRLREIAAVLEEPGRDAYWTPLAGRGRPVQFPLRLAGAAGDVFLSMPLVFVVDFQAAHVVVDAGEFRASPTPFVVIYVTLISAARLLRAASEVMVAPVPPRGRGQRRRPANPEAPE